MRRITPAQIVTFAALVTVAVALDMATLAAFDRLPLGDFRGVVLFILGCVLLQIYAIAVYRFFIATWPLAPGDIAAGSRQEFIYHVYILFFLILFYPVIRSSLLPTPLMRTYYLALGTRLGENTYCQGILHDPPFVVIGRDSVVGQSALLIPHIIEGARLGHEPIVVGDRVTIGAQAVVLSGVTIGSGAIVATGAVVSKGTRIGAGETWGGIPARRLDGVDRPGMRLE